MNTDALCHQLIGQNDPLPAWVIDLPETDIEAVVKCLKREADSHWSINVEHSLMLATLIQRIGQARGDLRLEALGVMAYGDASKITGALQEAWETLDRAGNMFQQAQHPVGWARTRIGRLGISVNLNRAEEALTDAEIAQRIFEEAGEREFVLRLYLNRAVVFDELADHHRALEMYQAALHIAESLGEAGQPYMPQLYTNIGVVYTFLGDFRRALECHELTRQMALEQGEIALASLADLNIAYVMQDQGHYRRALQNLQRAQEGAQIGHYPMAAAWARRVMVECYLSLTRYAEARDLAKEVAAEFAALGADLERALTFQRLAAAEAALGNYASAEAALDTAESLFAVLGASAWNGITHLRRGVIALRQQDYSAAEHKAALAAEAFESSSQITNRAAATLLQGQIAYALGDLDAALSAGEAALKTARHNEISELRYSAHVLLGHIMQANGHLLRACREYQAAAAAADRVQQGLTITMRPGFLEDKTEALHALIRLHLNKGNAAAALTALERAKSQVLLGYLANRESLHWSTQDPRSNDLIEKLDQLRAEHHWYYRIAHEVPDQNKPNPMPPEQALKELAAREKRMRAISEQLYLHSSDGLHRRPTIPTIEAIQAQLSEGATLIEYYNDGTRLWAFVLTTHQLVVHPLALTTDALHDLIGQYQANIDWALAAGDLAASAGLVHAARRLGQRLYAALLAPMQAYIAEGQRLIVVPYGALHYLPFHLLHTGDQYLIEQNEVVIWPAAGISAQRSVTRSGGALTLAHSRDGLLPTTLIEARKVNERFGGALFCEEDASRAVLAAEPRQILHIAAHGEHRIDQPGLSFIELSDGQLYTDDLLQLDLSYELVTLSACETGRAYVSGGDELIGLGRGFLYSGAGALITSLWRVDDASAVRLIDEFYAALASGASKAAALRSAQRSAIADNPDRHPAFWGAFQLIGNPEPLHAACD